MTTEIIDRRQNYPWPETTATYDYEANATTIRSYFGARSYSDASYQGRVRLDEAQSAEEWIGEQMAPYGDPIDLNNL